MRQTEDQAASAPAIRVGTRELRNNLTRYLREVRQGTSILVTSRDAVIAEIRTPSARLRPARRPGALAGQIHLADDFDSWPAGFFDATEA